LSSQKDEDMIYSFKEEINILLESTSANLAIEKSTTENKEISISHRDEPPKHIAYENFETRKEDLPSRKDITLATATSRRTIDAHRFDCINENNITITNDFLAFANLH